LENIPPLAPLCGISVDTMRQKNRKSEKSLREKIKEIENKGKINTVHKRKEIHRCAPAFYLEQTERKFGYKVI
jgi:hypothetical protein